MLQTKWISHTDHLLLLSADNYICKTLQLLTAFFFEMTLTWEGVDMWICGYLGVSIPACAGYSPALTFFVATQRLAPPFCFDIGMKGVAYGPGASQ